MRLTVKSRLIFIPPLMSVPDSGSSAFSTVRTAFWCRRCSGGEVDALKVSSRKVTPTPSTPPTARKLDGVQGLFFIISANRARRTQKTWPLYRRHSDPRFVGPESWRRRRSRPSPKYRSRNLRCFTPAITAVKATQDEARRVEVRRDSGGFLVQRGLFRRSDFALLGAAFVTNQGP
jgi:hypothetical protein